MTASSHRPEGSGDSRPASAAAPGSARAREGEALCGHAEDKPRQGRRARIHWRNDQAAYPSEPPGHGASGSMNRSSCPESVRYVSVTIVVQRRLLTDETEDDTTYRGPRDGRIPRSRAVLAGSGRCWFRNQRRLSRRFWSDSTSNRSDLRNFPPLHRRGHVSGMIKLSLAGFEPSGRHRAY